MLGWYADIKKLIAVSGAERNAFVSGAVLGRRESVDPVKDEEFGGELDNDEADEVPYSAEPSALEVPLETKNKRPEGGRFPSEINISRGTTDTTSILSGDSSRSIIGAAGALPGDYGRPRSGSQSSTWSYDEKVCIHTADNALDGSVDNHSTLLTTPWKPKRMNLCLLEQKFPLPLSVACLSGTITPNTTLLPKAKVPQLVVGALHLVNQLQATGSILLPDSLIREWALPRGISRTLTGATLSRLTRTSRAARLSRENPHLASPPLVTESTLSPDFTSTLLSMDIIQES